MIEAMACGTPVLAFRCGSVPEIVDDGCTGRIVSSVEEAAQAIPTILNLDRKAIRARFEERFSASRMAADYLKIYQNLVHRRPVEPEAVLSAFPLAARSLAVTGHNALGILAAVRDEAS
jgi:Glycosyl transferases group 1